MQPQGRNAHKDCLLQQCSEFMDSICMCGASCCESALQLRLCRQLPFALWKRQERQSSDLSSDLLYHLHNCHCICFQFRLKNEAGGHLRFIDLHGKVLTFRTSARPFRRCLVFQARYAAKQALAEGRMNKQLLADMSPYLVSVSPQASNIEVKEQCVLVTNVTQCRKSKRMCAGYSHQT